MMRERTIRLFSVKLDLHKLIRCLDTILSIKNALDHNRKYVPNFNLVPRRCAGGTREFHVSYGTHLLDHLAAYAACLTGGEVAVVAFLQINANLPWCSVSILKPCFYHIIGELHPFIGIAYCL